MTTLTRTRLTLELESAEEPIQGRIGEEGGMSREFVGWLGLASALGEMLRLAPLDVAEPTPAEEGG